MQLVVTGRDLGLLLFFRDSTHENLRLLKKARGMKGKARGTQVAQILCLSCATGNLEDTLCRTSTAGNGRRRNLPDRRHLVRNGGRQGNLSPVAVRRQAVLWQGGCHAS
jgi:hypothetical protein